MSALLKQLGETIRQQRLSLQPQDVGLPAAGRRRGGLSQQEVAVLSGVSTRWLARLEQGQFKAADTELFRRVLNILCFSTQEQERLLRQAGWQPEYWSEVSQQQLQNHLQKLLDGMDYPAYVVDHLWNRVRWNKPAARLFTHWLGKQVQYTNFIDYLLLDPHSRLFILHWEKHVVLWLGRFFNKIQPYLETKAWRSLWPNAAAKARCLSGFTTNGGNSAATSWACVMCFAPAKASARLTAWLFLCRAAPAGS